MMSKAKFAIWAFAALAALATGQSSPPGLINYQGRLTNSSDQPITSAVDVTFTFWDAESGGSQIGSFSDTDTVTPDSNGLYCTLIGDDPGNLVPDSIFSGESVWLNVNVAGEDLVPRKRVVSVGYAFHSGTAESALKNVLRSFVVASGKTVTAGDVAAMIGNGNIKPGNGEPLPPSNTTFNHAATYDISAAALPSSKVVIAYRDVGNSNYGTAVVGDVSGGTITFGSKCVFNSAITDDISAAALSSSQVVIAYRDQSNSERGTAVVGVVSDGTITFGSEYVFSNAPTYDISAAALSSSQVVIAYRDAGNSYYGTAVVGDVSGGTVAFGSRYVFNSAITSYISAVALLASKALVAYYSTNGRASVLEDAFLDAGQPIGIAAGSGSAGQNVPVVLYGVSDSHSGLTVGARYYAQTDGSLTTTPGLVYVGRAISPTEILVDLSR